MHVLCMHLRMKDNPLLLLAAPGAVAEIKEFIDVGTVTKSVKDLTLH